MIASVLVLRQLETLYTSLSESLEAEARAGAGARRTTVRIATGSEQTSLSARLTHWL